MTSYVARASLGLASMMRKMGYVRAVHRQIKQSRSYHLVVFGIVFKIRN